MTADDPPHGHTVRVLSSIAAHFGQSMLSAVYCVVGQVLVCEAVPAYLALGSRR